MVLKVLFLYIPLPMFWALFDQQVTTNLFCPCISYKTTNRKLTKCPELIAKFSRKRTSRSVLAKFIDTLNKSSISSTGLKMDPPGDHHGRRLCKYFVYVTPREFKPKKILFCTRDCVLRFFFLQQGILIIQPDQMQVRDLTYFVVMLMILVPTCCWHELIEQDLKERLAFFPPDCQPYLDPDFGANHGQCDLPADFQVQIKLHVSFLYCFIPLQWKTLHYLNHQS